MGRTKMQVRTQTLQPKEEMSFTRAEMDVTVI